MTPREAEKSLLDRHKRVESRKAGPVSLQFTMIEKLAVQTLAASGHSQATIANRARMSLAQIKRAFEQDSELRDAYDMGIAEERLKIEQSLMKTASDPKNPRQVQAANALLKARHGVTEGGGASVAVSVQNVLALPAPQDPRSYTATLKRIAKKGAPTIIEAPSADRVPALPPDDPVTAVK